METEVLAGDGAAAKPTALERKEPRAMRTDVRRDMVKEGDELTGVAGSGELGACRRQDARANRERSGFSFTAELLVGNGPHGFSPCARPAGRLNARLS